MAQCYGFSSPQVSGSLSLVVCVILPWPCVAAPCFLSAAAPLRIDPCWCRHCPVLDCWLPGQGCGLAAFPSVHVYEWPPAHALCLATSRRPRAVSHSCRGPVPALALFPPELSPCRLRGALLGRRGQAGGGWFTPLIPALERQRQVNLCEFKASLLYLVTSQGYM